MKTCSFLRWLRAAVVCAAVGSVSAGWADIPASAYVQDGLLAQWDGIENAGAGTHQADATTWTDLSGNGHDLTLPATGVTIGDKTVSLVKTTLATDITELATTGSFCGEARAWATDDYKYSDVTRCLFFNCQVAIWFRNTSGLLGVTSRRSSDGKRCFFYSEKSKVLDDIKAHHTYSVGTTPTGIDSFAIDGVEEGAKSSPFYTEANPTSSRLSLGNADVTLVYNGVRIYNRLLSADEQAFNANIDKVRFEGTDPTSLTWPNGYRWNPGSQKSEVLLSVAGEEGATVSFDNESFAASASGWFAMGSSVTVYAKPATGQSIAMWTGQPTGAQISNDKRTVTFVLNSPLSITAVSHGAVTLRWRGGANAVASDVTNWANDDGSAAVMLPIDGDAIVLDANSGNLTWDLADVAPSSWMQTKDYVGTVTLKVGTSRAEAGSVAPDGVNRELHVLGNVDLQGGTLTCGGNSGLTAKANPEAINSSEGNYRLWLRADGNVTVGTGATVDVSRCGFNYGLGKGAIGLGGCHGGTDYQAHPGSCFGNVYEPAEVGPGGNSSFSTYGAGAVKIVAGGQLRVDGLIDARPSDKRPTGYTGAVTHYTAAGGSIWLTANSLAGAGMIRADGGPGTTAPTGGGGRIAIYLKGAGETLDGFTGTLTCYGAGNNMSMPGTIYCELAGDEPHHGELIVRNRNAAAPSRYQDDNTNNAVCTPLIPMDGAATTYRFRKISLYGGAILAVAANVTLDLTDTEIAASEGSYSDALTLLGGTLRLPGSSYTFSNLALWVSATGSTIEFADGGMGTLTLEKGGRFDSPIRIPGSLVLAGGNLTHTAQGKGYKRYWIDLDVPGDLTVAAGAAINATACGYTGGPGAPVTSGAGYSYGGIGADAVADERCYGDPRNPDECGSAGASAGGLVKLKVGGTFNLNGSVLARGSIGSSAGGTGGGVNITAGRLVGAGPINASSMLSEYNWTQYHSRWDAAGAGGGRVAISITAQDATFDDYTGVIEVVGSANNGKKRKGGNGTIYLRRPGEGLEDGTLILDVKNDDPSAGAGICAKMGNITVGNVILRNKGALNIRKGLTVSVKGDVTNGDGSGKLLGELGDAESEPGGIALVDEGKVSHLTGPLDFTRLSCTLPGKTVKVATDQAAYLGVVAGGLLDLHGDETTPVYLRSMTDGSQWTLKIEDGARLNLQYLDVKDSDASQGWLMPSANDSKDSGNNKGWTFVNIKEGEIVTWTGAALTAGWGNPQNWISESAEVRAPTETDNIVIPSGCSVYPEFSAGVTVNGLEIASGASLNLNGFSLTVTEKAKVGGALVCTGSEQLSLEGDVDFTGGSFAAANSTVTIAGEQGQVVNLGGLRFDSVALAGAGRKTFAASFETRRLMAASGSGEIAAEFGHGIEVRAQQLYLDGGEAAGISLTGVDGVTWKLSVLRYQQVRGVAVANCNATGGMKIWDDTPYVDNGGNANWGFSDGAMKWTGAGANADFTNELNWAGGKVPAATDRVKLVGGETINFPEDAAIASLELMGGVTHLTAANGAKLSVGGILYAEDGTKCYLDVPTAAGSALIRSGAHIVCTPSTTTAAAIRRIDLAVAGDMEIEPDGWIDAVGRGFSPGSGWGNTTRAEQGNPTACYGHGGTMDKVWMDRTYGSVFEPTLPGTGGSTSHHAEGCDPELDAHGGGVIRLQVGGTLLLNGTVSADGWTKQNYYAATGGSVWLTVGRLAGAGLVTAKGGLVLTSTPGCGGRVAVYRTAETKEESAFAGVIRANGGSSTAAGSASTSAPGTVYLSYADTAEKAGEIVIDNLGGYVEYARNTKAGAVLTSQFGDQPEDFRNATVRVGTGAGLTISADMRVKDVSLEAASAYLVFPTPKTEGSAIPTLTIASSAHKHGRGWLGKVLPDGTGAAPRKTYAYIRWILPGMMVIIR